MIDLPEDGGDGGESCDPGEAGAAGCEFCRFTCSRGIDDAGHCYFFADPTNTYNDAIIACRGAAGHVVTVASDREAAFVAGLAQDASAHWVGLIFDNALNGYASPSNEPGWPNEGESCPGCFALGADDAGAFPLGTGADASANNACLVAEDGGWTRVECSGEQVRTTLCEREPIGQRIYPCGGLLRTDDPTNRGDEALRRVAIGDGRGPSAFAVREQLRRRKTPASRYAGRTRAASTRASSATARSDRGLDRPFAGRRRLGLGRWRRATAAVGRRPAGCGNG